MNANTIRIAVGVGAGLIAFCVAPSGTASPVAAPRANKCWGTSTVVYNGNCFTCSTVSMMGTVYHDPSCNAGCEWTVTGSFQCDAGGGSISENGVLLCNTDLDPKIACPFEVTTQANSGKLFCSACLPTNPWI